MRSLENAPGMTLAEPVNYIRFMSLVRTANLAITDSGGIQEETTILGVPCLTLRPNTERPITIEQGTNRLVGTAPAAIRNLEELAGILQMKAHVVVLFNRRLRVAAKNAPLPLAIPE